MRSSRAYAANRLELPAVTLADRVGVMLVALAAGCAVYAALRQGWGRVAAVVALAGMLVIGIQAFVWTRSRQAPRRWLETTASGGLSLRTAGGPALPARLGSATRLLGGSVFIDADSAVIGGGCRVRRWLTPFDVPRDMLRRWTILLLASERMADRDGPPVAVA